jgi:hypothetical protein
MKQEHKSQRNANHQILHFPSDQIGSTQCLKHKSEPADTTSDLASYGWQKDCWTSKKTVWHLNKN